ncbi:MAG: hypothetical protein P0Y53_24125 [Candidatus Pseudobacter hemicellulosilyticus]|uniref:Fibronectin type-III domain-containing protein n=1 Tax=Candidatus Pseudobacter hemicellulosilyticus TaxID=3121375 RepID=A0AAJ6BH64_9BACT|nr:MAG: hypothetical protein P0Y53_24125 [Pseudobacter sp.]
MRYLLFVCLFLYLAGISCKKDDAPSATLPSLTTTPVSNISGSIAVGGGAIIDNGNADISASGICWSSTNKMPTISDDTTKGNTSNGAFTAQMANLQPSTAYYVRAYAINSAGVGYGEVLSFNTGNGVPEAKNPLIEGQPALTNKIKVSFNYSDPENDPQAGTTYQWFIANNATDTISSPGSIISGAMDSVYNIAGTDLNKFLRVSITPKSSSGASTGTTIFSKWVGPVGPALTTATFMYNGQEVTYGIITSSTTGKKWLDRNLGALQVATSPTDYLAYGDLFQWGRPADGHQLINWTSSTAGTPINGTTETKFTSNSPNSNLFVITNTAPHDWVDPSNFNRWANDPQGACPFGWHVPTKTEWSAEGKSAINNLHLTNVGERANCCGGILLQTGINGCYWTSSIQSQLFYFFLTSEGGSAGFNVANFGRSIRCIKDFN